MNAGLEPFEKADLSAFELKKVQTLIASLQKKGLPAAKIISKLQSMNKKLAIRWKAQRAFWTQVKQDDTAIVANASQELGIDKFRVILSPNACKICKQKTNDGSRIFKSEDIEKSGFGHIPPFHPNCYCILVPKI